MPQIEPEHIEICKELIYSILKWNRNKKLQQRNFEYLSEVIFEKTKVNLSSSTLRRLWANDYKSLPQVTTLNALARFLDYKDWNEFVLNSKKGQKIKTKHTNNTHKIALLVSVSTILLLVTVLFIKPWSTNESFEDLHFASEFENYHGIPTTVKFKHNIKNLSTENVVIQLSWNKNERVDVKTATDIVTSTYYYPGYHWAKLIINDEVVEKNTVYITTDDWVVLMRADPYDVIPVYLNTDELISNGILSTTQEILDKNNIILHGNNFWMSYFYSNRVLENIDGDNFILKSTLRNNTNRAGIICNKCMLFIYTENDVIILPLCNTGCAGELTLQFSDNRILSKSSDLSSFECDMNNWQNISVINNNKNVSIKRNGDEIYTLKYEQALGKIKTIHYYFEGFGAIESINIENLEGKQLFIDEFER